MLSADKPYNHEPGLLLKKKKKKRAWLKAKQTHLQTGIYSSSGDFVYQVKAISPLANAVKTTHVDHLALAKWPY